MSEPGEQVRSAARATANRQLTAKLALFAVGSFAFGFALVPLYDVFCEITGFGDQTTLTEQRVVAEAPDQSRLITVEFLAELPTVGSWEFRPVVKSMQVHPGKLYEVDYRGAQPDRPRHDRAGRAERFARPGRGIFPQDRVLLLHAAEFRGR